MTVLFNSRQCMCVYTVDSLSLSLSEWPRLKALFYFFIFYFFLLCIKNIDFWKKKQKPVIIVILLIKIIYSNKVSSDVSYLTII